MESGKNLLEELDLAEVGVGSGGGVLRDGDAAAEGAEEEGEDDGEGDKVVDLLQCSGEPFLHEVHPFLKEEEERG